MIVCEGVSVSLGSREVLSQVSLTLERGEIVGIVGPNGAGKSTLLRVLAGLLRPSRGSVRVDGDDAFQQSAEALAKTRAFLQQDSTVAFDFRVDELVLLGRAPHARYETAACRALAGESLALLGLAERTALSVEDLSGGERQRAHLARVLTQVGLGKTGSYLLLDEPVSAQDPFWQLAILEQLRALSGRGLGIAIVLHDLNLAARFCDRIGLLSAARPLVLGAPRQVLTEQRLAETFDVDVHVGDDPFDRTRPCVSFRPRSG